MNTPISVENVLKELVERYPIDKLVLFGSRAVGDNEERSDFDIAVFSKSLCKRKFSKLRLDAADSRTLYWVSLVHFESNPAALQERILQQGIIIYERTQTAG
ncbi:nucleotidyltransferase family protein [Teredinibacter turnerae]|uniref:nucleotidyltransferase family protein n=1 Tax=Teredinibacter turnerae TaxID=2426 RepID=UPI0009B6330D|nr:nucleotidyltransferase domain-containing protein [Teredinibacter turnerae]